MKSRADPRFWRLYERLPDHVQRQARKPYELWQADPQHPGLRFKQVDDVESIYSVRVGTGYRALGLLEEETMVWFWIGRHDEYERLLKDG